MDFPRNAFEMTVNLTHALAVNIVIRRPQAGLAAAFASQQTATPSGSRSATCNILCSACAKPPAR
jgi:hypothetical protein